VAEYVVKKKLEIDNILLKAIIPSFHYSIIPWFMKKLRPL